MMIDNEPGQLSPNKTIDDDYNISQVSFNSSKYVDQMNMDSIS